MSLKLWWGNKIKDRKNEWMKKKESKCIMVLTCIIVIYDFVGWMTGKGGNRQNMNYVGTCQDLEFRYK